MSGIQSLQKAATSGITASGSPKKSSNIFGGVLEVVGSLKATAIAEAILGCMMWYMGGFPLSPWMFKMGSIPIYSSQVLSWLTKDNIKKKKDSE